MLLLSAFSIPLSRGSPSALFLDIKGHSLGWLLRHLGLFSIWVLHFLVEWLGVFWLTDLIECMFICDATLSIFVALSFAWILGNVWQFRALRKDPLVLWRRPK